MRNTILNADSYKSSHYLQYPPRTSHVSSYIEARGGPYAETVFFGLQAFLKQYLTQPISEGDIDVARTLIATHGVPFNEAGWRHILNRHGGRLPVSIEAVAEGTRVPTGNVLVQVVNTDPECFWLTSYLETALLRAVWYPTTVATLSAECRANIAQHMARTCETLESLPAKLHDFGARGATSGESAALGGLAHLVSFDGTDTMSAVLAAKQWYQTPDAGVSIPAAEHSTMTAWGKDAEVAAYRNMLHQFAQPGAAVSVVSDSYDLWHAIESIWGSELRDTVINSGGTLVIRPDSGDPKTVVLRTLALLAERFGTRTNSKGFLELPPCVRIIQGDGVSPATIDEILGAMANAGFSADNIVFGMGGELHQKVNRDTCKFAMKASAARIDGRWRDVHKDPKTDPGKRSKRGRLGLVPAGSTLKTVSETGAGTDNLLVEVFRDGELLIDQSLTDIRRRARD